jgi:hypothetical protein
MSIKLEYNGEFIIARMTGSLTLADLLAHGRELEALETSLPVAPHRLADLSPALVVDLDFVEMNTFAAKRRAAKLKNPVKSAIVAADAVQFGFARMFQTLNSNPDIRVEIFQNEETALAWLRE